MSYLDRLRECSYTDPSGTVHALLFDEVIRSGEKKSGVFELPQQDRTEVQDLGMSGVDYQMTFYIAGEDYDAPADAFWAGLSLRHTDSSPGILAHPRWGDVTVKPLTFTQSESFVDGMGRAVFTVQFKTVDVSTKFPVTSTNFVSSIEALTEDTVSTAVLSFIGPKTIKDEEIVTRSAVGTLYSMQNILASIVSLSDDLSASFNSGINLAIDGIGALVDAPTTMAQTIIDLMRIPSTASCSITQKITAYSDLFNILATPYKNTNPEFLSLTLSMSAIATAESSIKGDIQSRDEAIFASDSLASLLSYYQDMMSTVSPDEDMVSSTVELIALVHSYLLDSSFWSKSARSKNLEYESDPITETWLAYRDVTKLGQFCQDNSIHGEEYFILPIGRYLVWYA